MFPLYRRSPAKQPVPLANGHGLQASSSTQFARSAPPIGCHANASTHTIAAIRVQSVWKVEKNWRRAIATAMSVCLYYSCYRVEVIRLPDGAALPANVGQTPHLP